MSNSTRFPVMPAVNGQPVVSDTASIPIIAPAAPSASDSLPDPFDPAALRLTGDMAAAIGVKKILTTVPVRKPDKSWFVHVHPDDEFCLVTTVIELKEDRETYLVAPDLRQELAAESTFSPRAFFTAINRQGVLFLWPVRMPGPDGKTDEWSKSAMEAARLARKGWVRVAANMSLGAYEVFQATGNIPDPDWPATSFRELIHIAFKDKFIDTMDHPVLRKLRGEV